jgi:heptosyltransferase II
MPKRILIIRPDAIGDVVLTVPAILAIREKFPEAHIAVLMSDYTRDLLAGHPAINEIIHDDLDRGKIKNLSQYFNFVGKLRAKKFDLSVHFYNEFPYALAALLAGIPRRLGDTSKTPAGWLYNLKVRQNWGNLTRHEVEHNLNLVRPIVGEGIRPEIKLYPPAAAQEAVGRLFKENQIVDSDLKIGIHLGTGGTARVWLPQRFAKIADALQTNFGAKVILTGSAKEEKLGHEVETLCRTRPINLVGKTKNLSEFMALYSRLNLYIGRDTGPMHLAAAFKVPVVALFIEKFFKPTEWGPWLTRHVVIRKKTSCRLVCRPSRCRYNYCLTEISPEEVMAAVKTLRDGGGNTTLEGSKTDWFKKSANIITNREEVRRELSIYGYRAAAVGKSDSLPEMMSQMIKEDTNVIHWVGHNYPLALIAAKLLATPSLPVPPIFIYEKARADHSLTGLLKLYQDKFNR